MPAPRLCPLITWVVLAIGLLAIHAAPASADGTAGIGPGAGRFLFQDPQTETGKTLPVWTYRPAGFTPDTPILFVMHGVKRNADAYRNNWIALADRHDLLIVAPEFDKENFPKSWAYNLGNVMARDKKGAPLRPTPNNRWSFPVVDRIFETVRSASGSRRTTFSIFGHSAGAQFVHRYLMFTGGPKVDLAIAANAGWYTLPDYRVAFPYGLDGSALPEARLREAFGRPMIVLLGEEDTKQDRYFRQTPEAMQQGPDRLARGRFYFELARNTANRIGAPFNWRIATVPGVGHSNRQMATTAAMLIREEVAGRR